MRTQTLKLVTLLIWVGMGLSFLAGQQAAADDGSRLLDQWAEAIGGAEKLASIRSSHVQSEVKAAGMKGTVDHWSTSEGAARTYTDLAGVYTELIVFNGHQGWRLDHNGKVAVLEGTDLETEITAAYMSSYSHLTPDRLPGEVSYVGVQEGLNVLHIQPTGGRAFKVYLDPDTHLPVREVHPEGDRDMTVTLEDWRAVDGLLLPYKVTQSTGDVRYDAEVLMMSVTLNPELSDELFIKPDEGGKDYRFTSGFSARDIPFELNSNHIYVQAMLNGKGPLWFILDTGAGATVLSREKAEELGLPLQGNLEGRGAGEASVDVALVPSVSFELPGVTLQDQTAVAIALGALTIYEGRAIDGILGYDLISRFVMEIDYENRRLHFYEQEFFSGEGHGKAMPFELQDNHPHVYSDVQLQDGQVVRGKFLIDTGARSALSLNRPFCEEHDVTNGIKTIRGGFAAGIGGETSQSIGRVQALNLGTFLLSDIVTGFSEDQGGATADRETAGIIGGDILRRFSVTFDYSKSTLYLRPNAHFEEAFEYDMSGMWIATVAPEHRHFQVRKVIDGSPAGKAGLKEDDVIVTIDGKPTSEYILEDVRRMFREDERDCILGIQDGERVRSVKLTTRRLI
jgi:predicted aspartyl protease